MIGDVTSKADCLTNHNGTNTGQNHIRFDANLLFNGACRDISSLVRGRGDYCLNSTPASSGIRGLLRARRSNH